YWCGRQPINWHCLYDIDNDPEETENRLGGRDEADMLELLKTALANVEAPLEQLERLGLG
ncbi:MAG: sulfatase, partial [Proteobacteria bacterium]|nr:sulfatase [Pseudomonadota bacterium]